MAIWGLGVRGDFPREVILNQDLTAEDGPIRGEFWGRSLPGLGEQIPGGQKWSGTFYTQAGGAGSWNGVKESRRYGRRGREPWATIQSLHFLLLMVGATRG